MAESILDLDVRIARARDAILGRMEEKLVPLMAEKAMLVETGVSAVMPVPARGPNKGRSLRLLILQALREAPGNRLTGRALDILGNEAGYHPQSSDKARRRARAAGELVQDPDGMWRMTVPPMPTPKVEAPVPNRPFRASGDGGPAGRIILSLVELALPSPCEWSEIEEAVARQGYSATLAKGVRDYLVRNGRLVPGKAGDSWTLG